MRTQLTHGIAALAAVALAGGLIACDNRILRVTAPDQIQPGALGTASALPTVTASVYGDFGYAYAGDQGDDEGVIELGGLLGDEWHSSDTFPTRNQIDERLTTNDNAQAGSIYNRLQRARVTAEFAAQQYAALEPGNALEAEAYSFAGYAITLLAENYCTMIPFSKENSNGTITYGQLESTNQVLHDARVRFDSAIAIATAAKADTEIYFAEIGKARALVDSGDYADAALAVANVPTTFVFNQGYALTPRRAENGVFEFNVSEGRYTVPNVEGGEGPPYRTSGDPRVPWELATTKSKFGFDAVDSLFYQLLYTSHASPIPIATGAEARIIEAEAALAAGNTALFLTKVNAARTYFPGTTPAAGVPAGMTPQQFLFQERAFDLWLTAHRLGDERRMMRQYGFLESAAFPTGAYPKGGTYGTGVALPLPITEAANPNFRACDTTVP